MKQQEIFKSNKANSLIVATNIILCVISTNVDGTENLVTDMYVSELEQAQLAKENKYGHDIVVKETPVNHDVNNFYVERRSYGTGRETDPPRYVKQLNKTWLADHDDALANFDWLDVGLDYRFRYEHRDNDFRRAKEAVDEPYLLRTRGFIAIKNIIDPFRFTLEVEDARRNHSEFSRDFDTRDINQAEFIQAYLEFYFRETPLEKDIDGNDRPISIKVGRHAFEYLDRRLIARNEWRNTTNTFQGVRATIGQQRNDWQFDLLALKPVQRLTVKLDEVDHAQDFYGVIGDWRRWSEYVTFQPYYFLLKQDGQQVRYDVNGNVAVPSNRIDRKIHAAGLRAYGVVGKSGWDYDASYTKQWGYQDRLNNYGGVIAQLNHDAYAYNMELGYSIEHAWKPRVSVFYGFASGDNNPNDTSNQRFDRLFGFARPWSNNDYIQMENISTPKLRVELEPIQSWFSSLKVDAGYSWYRLDSARDRWNAGGNLRDASGESGKNVGEELDIRVRFPVNKFVGANIGYARFWAGDFAKTTTQHIEPDRRDTSNFLYVEITASAF